MKGTALAALLLTATHANAAPAAEALLRVEPPPGWADATPAKKGPLLVAALKGPERSSFQLVRVPGVPLDNAGAVRLYLRDVLEGIRTSSRKDFQSDGRVERRSFRNGMVAHLLRASLDGKPRLVLALADAGGSVVVATLNSAAPEAMLTLLFESVTFPREEGAVQESGLARSVDGQLEVALGGGLRSRALSDAERKAGFQLVMQGSGSELFFQRIDDDSTPANEQAAIVRAAAGGAPGAEADSATPAEEAPTPAGPVGVYSWSRLEDPAAKRFAVGFLPWGYWGYSLLARGPAADELLVGVLAALKRGPNAVDRIVAATPVIPVEGASPDKRALLAAGGAAVLVLGLLLWSRARKKDNVPS
jgi:hypothetical protein